jgi:hypothetical protein
VFPEDGYDPWDFFGEPCPKPVVVAIHGRCNTLGNRARARRRRWPWPPTMRASGSSRWHAESSPLGGATFRLPARLGAPGMRYLLTGRAVRRRDRPSNRAGARGRPRRSTPRSGHRVGAHHRGERAARRAARRSPPRAPPNAPHETRLVTCC